MCNHPDIDVLEMCLDRKRNFLCLHGEEPLEDLVKEANFRINNVNETLIDENNEPLF
jgi:hypothetical protein